jgi:hypothetical protein
MIIKTYIIMGVHNHTHLPHPPQDKVGSKLAFCKVYVYDNPAKWLGVGLENHQHHSSSLGEI